jgi:hypothetical protein
MIYHRNQLRVVDGAGVLTWWGVVCPAVAVVRVGGASCQGHGGRAAGRRRCRGGAERGGGHEAGGHRDGERAFPSWKRSILTEIYLRGVCSCQEILRRRNGHCGQAESQRLAQEEVREGSERAREAITQAQQQAVARVDAIRKEASRWVKVRAAPQLTAL